MMTVSKAYQMLKQEGFIVTDRRSGAIVRRRENIAGVSESTIRALRISFSELRAAGLKKEEIIDLCRKVYEEGEMK